MKISTQTRRQFLKTSAWALAPLIISGSALGAKRPTPSQRINLGVIGVGSRGDTVMREFLHEPDVQVVAVCDVHRLHYREKAWGSSQKFGLEPAQKTVESHYASAKTSGKYSGCAAFTDFRELCARKDIDAVLVATPDHWHALNTMEALRNGKDVYCEKPFTHFFAEGQILCREVSRRKAIVQVGSQQRSDALFQQAVELVRNHHLGKLKRVEVGLPQGYTKPQSDTTLAALPEGLDYELWCGPAPKLPYMAARHHRWWRGHRAFGGGTLMDWIGHHNDIAHWGMALDRLGPTTVEAVGWTFLDGNIYNTPVDYEIRCKYDSGIESVISSKLHNGAKWIGESGWVHVTRGKITASDPHWLESGFDRGPWKTYASPGHVRNFLDCVKKRTECVASPAIAHRSITPGHLAFISQSLGRALRWDPEKELIRDDPEAQSALLAMPYRSPWRLKA